MEKEILFDWQLSPEQNLLNAIVIQAARDYRGAVKLRERRDVAGYGDWRNCLPPNWTQRQCVQAKRDCERFFADSWVWQFYDIDSNEIWERLESDAQNGGKTGKNIKT